MPRDNGGGIAGRLVIVAKLTQTIGLVAFIGVRLVLVLRYPHSGQRGDGGSSGTVFFAPLFWPGRWIMHGAGLLAPALRFADRCGRAVPLLWRRSGRTSSR